MYSIKVVIFALISILVNADDDNTACFQVIDAYSNTSQLYTLCVDSNKFDIAEVNQTCSECDNFYGNIATSTDLNYLWVLIAGALVFFMQTGFTMFRNIQLIEYILIILAHCLKFFK